MNRKLPRFTCADAQIYAHIETRRIAGWPILVGLTTSHLSAVTGFSMPRVRGSLKRLRRSLLVERGHKTEDGRATWVYTMDPDPDILCALRDSRHLQQTMRRVGNRLIFEPPPKTSGGKP